VCVWNPGTPIAIPSLDSLFILTILGALVRLPVYPGNASSETPVTSHPRLFLRSEDVPRLRQWATASNPLYHNGLKAVAAEAKASMDAGTIPSADSGGVLVFGPGVRPQTRLSLPLLTR